MLVRFQWEYFQLCLFSQFCLPMVRSCWSLGEGCIYCCQQEILLCYQTTAFLLLLSFTSLRLYEWPICKRYKWWFFFPQKTIWIKTGSRNCSVPWGRVLWNHYEFTNFSKPIIAIIAPWTKPSHFEIPLCQILHECTEWYQGTGKTSFFGFLEWNAALLILLKLPTDL